MEIYWYISVKEGPVSHKMNMSRGKYTDIIMGS